MDDLVLIMDYRNCLQSMADIIIEERFPNYSIEFGLVPQLSILWALHLQEEVDLVLEGLIQPHHIITI